VSTGRLCKVLGNGGPSLIGHVLTAFDRMNDTLNDPWVRRCSKVAADVLAAVTPAAEHPSAFNIARAGLDLGKVVIGLAEIDSDSYFDGDEWALPYPDEFNQTIIDVLRTYPHRTLVTTQIGTQIMLVDVDGFRAGWVATKSLFGARSNEQVYVETEHLDAAREAIRQALWRHFADKSIVFRRKRKTSIGGGMYFTFEHDDDVKPMPSRAARDLAQYLGRAIKSGVTRSLLLWGEPGTGKSCLSRAVIDILEMRCLRLRVEDLGHLQNSTLSDAITVFRPDAVVIDDLDRLQGSANHLFEMLTFLKRNVKLVFGTVNDRKKVPAALRRPGRFDERRKIDVIDHDVVRALLGPEFIEDFDLVKDWPIAYVEEYANRRRFLAPEELKETIRELKECMEELRTEANAKEQDDDSEDDKKYFLDDDAVLEEN